MYTDLRFVNWFIMKLNALCCFIGAAWIINKAYTIKWIIQDAQNGHFIYHDKIKKEN